MVERTIDEAAAAMAGRVIAGDGSTRFRGAAIDSRKAGGGKLFFALPGARADGHDFADDAVRRGAAGVVVHRAPAAPAPAAAWVRVEDTFRALHDLTRAVRETVPRQLVGITGSTGKTTTKELLAAMLGRRYRTAKSPGNLNNLYGFPVALLGVPDDCEWMVAEVGMSTPGELRGVSMLARPDVAVYTNVRPAHLENFGDLAAIADAKAELLAGLVPGGLVIANADDPWVMRIAERHRGPVLRYGRRDRTGDNVGNGENGGDGGDGRDRLDVAISDLRLRENGGVGSRFTLHAGGESAAVTLPLHGLYNAENCLAAATCALALGVPLADVVAAAAAAEGAPMRGRVAHLDCGATVIDDAYNANPWAVERALESAAAMPATRRLAVLGDMLELGPEAARYHRDAGARAAALGFSPVLGVGPLSRETVDAARAGGAEVEHFDDAAAAAGWARRALSGGALGEGDVVLVKGSRGIALEAVVRALTGEAG